MNRRTFMVLAGTAGSFRVRRVIARSVPGDAQSPRPEPPQPLFSDITSTSGITFTHRASRTHQKHLIETMGSGVALFDYDGNGYLDIFFVNGARIDDPISAGKLPEKSEPAYWNRLYRNNGNGTFTDVTAESGLAGQGYGMGVTVADYDNDGHPDLYVTSFGRNALYHNNGNGTFSDVTWRAGVETGGWSTGACFFDLDRDGHLDLLVTRYLDWDFGTNPFCGKLGPHGYRGYCPPDKFKPITFVLYRNNGDGTFTDVTAKSGFQSAAGKGLGVAVLDFDRDGWPDIAVANDTIGQQLFRNNRNGTFSEIGLTRGLAYDDNGHAFAGMGIDCQDYDNDGWTDVFINALSNQAYALYRNLKGTFEYVSGPSGIGAITSLYSGWGAKFLDCDNDGWKDLFVAQGHVLDQVQILEPDVGYLEPLLLLRNSNGQFTDVSVQSGAAFRVPRAGRGAAVGDIDNDGNMDVVVNCNDQAPVLLRNQGGTANRWLMIDTIGTRSNRDGIGAQLHLVGESGNEQWGIVSTAGSYLSASDKRVHFGLGADEVVRRLEITWPSGIVQRLDKIPSNQVLRVREPEPAR